MMRILATALALFGALLIAGSQNASGAELVVNGGFEAGTAGWSASSDSDILDTVAAPVKTDLAAGRLTGQQQQSHRVNQWVSIGGGQSYTLSGWVWLNDPAIERVYLAITWF